MFELGNLVIHYFDSFGSHFAYSSSDVVAEDHHMFYKCYFAAMWDSLDAPPLQAATKPKVELRPICLPAISYLVEADGCVIHIFNSVLAFSVVVTASMVSRGRGQVFCQQPQRV